MDNAHLNAIRLRLSHERARLAAATKPREIAFRKVCLAQIEKEEASELAFLAKRGIDVVDDIDAMSDDELLAHLKA